jgi:hypothetical protein
MPPREAVPRRALRQNVVVIVRLAWITTPSAVGKAMKGLAGQPPSRSVVVILRLACITTRSNVGKAMKGLAGQPPSPSWVPTR